MLHLHSLSLTCSATITAYRASFAIAAGSLPIAIAALLLPGSFAAGTITRTFTSCAFDPFYIPISIFISAAHSIAALAHAAAAAGITCSIPFAKAMVALT